MDSMIRNLKRHEAWEAKEGFEWTQWQALQLKAIKEFRERNAALVDEAFSKATPMMDNIIREAYHDGEQAFDAQRSEANAAKIKTYMNQGKLVADIPTDKLATAILEVDENGNLVWTNQAEQPIASINQPGLDQIPDKSFFKVNEPKLKAVMDDVHSDMDKVRYAALNRMGSGYQEIIHKADVFFATGTMTLQQAVDMASEEFLSAGLNCVEYENGRRVNIATYVEMALRTSARRAQMTAEGAKRDEWKEFLVISPALATTCKACHKYQALVMIDDVFAHGKPDGKHLLLSKAVDDNFLHPNCRHPLVTYFEGITQIPDNSPYDQTKSNYEAEQRQRMIETMIRRYKRLRDGSVDPANIAKYDLKVSQWEGLLKRHLAQNPDFRRKPEREKSNYERMIAEPSTRDKPIIPITDEAIKQVPLVKVGDDTERSAAIRSANKEILTRSREAGNVEVAGVFSSDFAKSAYVIGTGSEASLEGDARKMLSSGNPVYILHNHPRGGRLSVRDVVTFLSEENVLGIGYVSNAGTRAELLTKGAAFDRLYAIKEIRRAIKGISDDDQISRELYREIEKLGRKGVLDLWI